MSTDMREAPLLPSQVPKQPVTPPPEEHTRLRRWVEDCWSLTQTSRDWAIADRKMYDGDQLSAAVKRALRRRKQPEVVDNLIRPAVNGLLGVLDQSRTDPIAYPRNGEADQAAADVASKALRFAADEGKFDKHKSSAAKEYFTKSTACILIEGSPDGPVTYTPIPYDELIYDPHSKRLDFEDARYIGTQKWFYADDVKALYPEAWERLGDPVNVGALGGVMALTDKPEDATRWVDRKARRLLVVELYHRDGGQWQRTVYCAAGVLEQGTSPYVDDKGRTLCPFEAVSYEIDQDNTRYSHVRDMVSLQHSVNARKSRLGHLTNTRQIQPIGEGTQMVDVDVARAEAAKADGVIPPGYQIVPTADLAAGQAQLLQDDRGQLQRMGPTPAVLGRQEGSSQSGRARLVLQQAGMTELAPALAGIEDLENRCYRQTWFRMRQFWNAPKWIRVTDDLRAPKFLQVNEVEGYDIVPQPVMGPDGQPQADDFGQPAVQMVQQPRVKNRLAEMDLDIIVDSVPDTATLEQETFAELVKLTGGNLAVALTPEFELMIEISPLTDKTRILEKIRDFREKRDQAQAQQAQQQQQIAEQGMQVELAAKQAKTALDGAKAEGQQITNARDAFALGTIMGGEPQAA